MTRPGLLVGLVGLGCFLALANCSDPIPRTDAGGAAGTGSGNGTGGSGTATGTCQTGCGDGRNCCDEHCVNLQNDPQNCGSCGQPCAFGEYCVQSKCMVPACEATCETGESCCGGECCGESQLCCDPQGPVEQGPHCSDRNEYGTCPVGCAPLCK